MRKAEPPMSDPSGSGPPHVERAEAELQPAPDQPKQYIIGELVSGNPVKRVIYFILGILSLVLAGIGIVAPVIPTVGPVILAAFFFARSSPRFEGWLLKHPLFGHHIIDYRAGLGISMRIKVIATTAILVSFSLTIGLVGPVLGVGFVVGMVSLGVILVGILWAHRTKPAGVQAELVELPESAKNDESSGG